MPCAPVPDTTAVHAGKPSMDAGHPQVTFVIITYNQQAYIGAALEAAFAQTYSPLAIEISDDASTDATFEIAQAMCAAYRGPHRLMCTRNAQNMGLSAHVEFANRRATGEIIVAGAGDDVSVPNRVSRIVEEYLRRDRQSHYFFSLVRSMTATGELGGTYQSPGAAAANSKLKTALGAFPLAIGASQAYTRKFVNAFPAMNSGLWAEDQVFGLRGILIGPVTFINESLVNYRDTGMSNAPRAWSFRRYLKNQISVLTTYKQKAIDAFHANHLLLGLLIVAKLIILTLLFPLSPIFSIMRRVTKRSA